MSSSVVRHPEQRPPSGVMRQCRVVEVYDGDTVTVEIVTRARVRLLDCWTAEIRGTDGEEKVAGLAARDHLKAMAEGAEGEIFIPLRGADRLDDVLTMGRVLGAVWIGDDDRSLSERQVEAGHASRTKGGVRGE